MNVLSDEFYSVIPHDFGFQKMSSFVLRTNEDVKRKLEMLQSLSEVTFAIRLLSDVRADAAVDRITASYEKLACELEHLSPGDDVVALISRYVGTTAGNTAGHTHYTLEVEDVFAVRRSGEEERFRNGLGSRLGNHMLLWHGSRLSNWVRPPPTLCALPVLPLIVPLYKPQPCWRERAGRAGGHPGQGPAHRPTGGPRDGLHVRQGPLLRRYGHQEVPLARHPIPPIHPASPADINGLSW